MRPPAWQARAAVASTIQAGEQPDPAMARACIRRRVVLRGGVDRQVPGYDEGFTMTVADTAADLTLR